MSHVFLEVMLDKVTLQDFQEVISERHVVLHAVHVAVTSMASMVQNGIPYLYHIIKQFLTYVSVH